MSSMDLLTVAAGTNDLINRTTSLRENLYTRRSSEGVISSAMSMLEGMPPYRDLTLILNVIAKEVRISRRLVLNSFTGYSVEDAKPQGIFDFLIGYIPEKSALDIVPFGDTFAQPNLVTFACETIDIDKTTSKKGIVFTLEQKDDPAQNFTAGGDYFVESSLSTTDGINFDTLNLNVLNSKIDAAVKNLNDIEKIFSVPSVSDPLPRTLENGNFSYYDLFNNEIVGPLKELTDNYKNIYMNAFFNSEKVPIKSEAIDVMGAIIRSCVSPTGKLEMKKHKLCSILFLLAISDMLDEKEGPSATTKFKEELRIRLFDEFAVNPNTISVGDAGGPGSYALGDIKTTTLEEPFVGNPYVKYYDYTWKAILSILKKFAALPIYDSNSRTAFSKIKKSTLLFSVFDACLRYIAYITPFNLLATTFGNVDRLYSLTFARAGKPEYASAAAATATDARSWVYLDPAPEYKKFANGTYVKDSVTSGAGNEYFTNGEGPPATIRSNILYALSDGKSYPENSIRCLRNYLDSLKQKARDLKSLLEKDAGKQLLIEMNSYYSGDDKATTDQRARLLNMALSPEQLLLQYYMRREVGDRTNLALSADGDSRLAAIYPAFSTFPKNHSKLLPIQEMNLVSHDLLSSFFKTAAFLPNKGNNKKILTVGVPTGLFRSIKDTSAAGFLQEFDQVKNVMLLKVYRLNRFVPEVIFKPQRFLFQMNRFPIKELTDEYEPSMFSKAVFDPLMLPAKVVSNGSVRATSYYKGRDKEAALLRLAVDEYIDLYMNHSMSFLLGEYIRWFSGINVDDGSYYNYGSIKTQSVVKAQMGAYYDAIRSKSDTENAAAYAEFELPDGSRTKRSVIDTVNSKGLTVDMTNTLMSYLTNETFLASPLEIKRRATYPKKFARVFNIIVDPDDFVIDQHNTTAEGLTGLVSRGIAVKTGGAYKLRDTTPEDVTFDDYFVTIEPYSHK